MKIFGQFSPMSPERVEEGETFSDQMEIFQMDLDWRQDRIEDLEAEIQSEMQNFAEILEAKERQASRRKRKREDCSGCKESFSNACLDCKEHFSSKRMKVHHEKISGLKEEIEDIKQNMKTRQEARQAEINQEARQKEAEAKAEPQQDIKEENQSDYPTSSEDSSSEDSSEASSDADIKSEPDIKIEPEEENRQAIGMFNQIKSEPMYMNSQPNVSPGSSSPLSSSDEDMDTSPSENHDADDENSQHQRLFNDLGRFARNEHPFGNENLHRNEELEEALFNLMNDF